MSRNKILWICGIAWLRNDNTYFPEATYPGIVSGSAFQQAIIEGLEVQSYDVTILSDCDMASGNRLEWSHNEKSHDVRVAGNGNKVLRIPKKIKELTKELKHTNILEGIDYLIAYEMHFPYLVCLNLIKKLRPSIKTILICPDLSVHMDLNAKMKPIKRLLKSIENRISKKLLNSVDAYVLFTEQMQDYFAIYNKPYTVVEGVYRDKYSLDKVDKKRYIMHAGSLHYNTGIEELVSAFEQLEDTSVELWFFGSGAMDEYIQNKAEKNPRIRHMGFVDPKVLFEYEKQALMLVNVRNPKEEYTKYSFPSKTFEYMASGTPFLSTNLLGIPKEYKDYIVLINDYSIEAIKNGLNTIISMSDLERETFGENAKAFVLNKKNKIVQSSKVIDLLKKI